MYIFAPTYEDQVEEPYVIRYPSFPIKVAGAPVPNVLTGIFIKKVRELNIDVIHVHHPAIVGNVALSIRKKLGVPVVFTYHTRYEAYLHYINGLEKVEQSTGFINWYLHHFCNQCDLLVAPTPGILDYLQKERMKPPIQVMPTGIPMENFLPEQESVAAIRQQYLGTADYLTCTVSRLAKEKNLDFQIRGLSCLKRLLKKKGKTFRHMIIGDGPEKKNLMRQIEELGLTENIIFIGNVDNQEIKNYQAASDAFLFTSKSETQGIVLLEAMAVGNPVVAVEASGVRDVVKDGVNGYLTEEDTYWWAERTRMVLEEVAKREQLSQAARETAEMYSEEEVARQAEQYYRNVCIGAMENAVDNISLPHRYVV